MTSSKPLRPSSLYFLTQRVMVASSRSKRSEARSPAAHLTTLEPIEHLQSFFATCLCDMSESFLQFFLAFLNLDLK
ncbi:hypothetical protein [Nostoc sp.]|uniref:hypothetical protein n=2 Tax=Nostoc TaxID=1177 RepID=UPI001D665CF4|nr:hypothetical protein [Nostoc sp. JL34]